LFLNRYTNKIEKLIKQIQEEREEIENIANYKYLLEELYQEEVTFFQGEQ
jgi:hypothetical protein